MLLRRLLGRGGLRAIVLEICVEEAVPDACPYLGLLVVWLHVGFFHGAMTLGAQRMFRGCFWFSGLHVEGGDVGDVRGRLRQFFGRVVGFGCLLSG